MIDSPWDTAAVGVSLEIWIIGQSVVTTHLWMFSLRDSETVCIHRHLRRIIFTGEGMCHASHCRPTRDT